MVREGDDNDELRYSLRTLVNIPHEQVWIVGYRPAWVSPDVANIPSSQGLHKHENTWGNWQMMARTRSLSPSFLLMNDDFFLMRPRPFTPPGHAGPLHEWLSGLGNIGTQDRMRHTIKALEARPRVEAGDVLLSYEVHVPMVLDRMVLAEVMAFGQRYRDRSGAPPLAKRSLYGNYARAGGTRMDDPKVRDTKTLPDRGAYVWSTQDETFRYGRVGQRIRAAFPDPCAYERPRPVLAETRQKK